MLRSPDDDRKALRRLTSSLALLALILATVGIAVLLVGTSIFGSSVPVVLLAWSICFLSTLLAHVAGQHPQGDSYFAARMALQLVVRTVPPFVVTVWALHFAAPPLERGLVFYMILFYLIGLIADVRLTIGRLNALRIQVESSPAQFAKPLSGGTEIKRQ
jgi:hypothetical protein